MIQALVLSVVIGAVPVADHSSDVWTLWTYCERCSNTVVQLEDPVPADLDSEVYCSECYQQVAHENDVLSFHLYQWRTIAQDLFKENERLKRRIESGGDNASR